MPQCMRMWLCPINLNGLHMAVVQQQGVYFFSVSAKQNMYSPEWLHVCLNEWLRGYKTVTELPSFTDPWLHV